MQIFTQCCIVGGGPAGMMLGFLLARAGIDVQVLEKHADFLRDFRGDTIHPSTLDIMYELGLLDAFLALPHQEVSTLAGQVEGTLLEVADLSHVPTHCKFIALMPQWDFLNFLAAQGQHFPSFHLQQRAEVTGLLRTGDAVSGVRAMTPQGELEVQSTLVIGADGRHSVVRKEAGLEVIDFGAPLDVLWFRLPRRQTDPARILGYFSRGKIMVLLYRGDYWQCGFVIAKGSADEMHAKGLQAFRDGIVSIAPFLSDRVDSLADWDQIKLLTVQVDRLSKWSVPGLLCIGDAAHAMSPVGGVGINLAIQDAVAAANILAKPLLEHRLRPDDLERVQRRREFPTRFTQRLQILIQNRIIRRALEAQEQVKVPWIVRFLSRVAVIRRIPALLIGVGVRPEHVRTGFNLQEKRSV